MLKKITHSLIASSLLSNLAKESCHNVWRYAIEKRKSKRILPMLQKGILATLKYRHTMWLELKKQ
jgi:hypothetical protein